MATLARTFSSDIYDKMLDNPRLSSDQRVQIQRMRARRKTKEGEREFSAYMKETMSRKNVLEAQEERDALRALKERKEFRESWSGTAELEHMREVKMADQLDDVNDEIAALKASLGLEEEIVSRTTVRGGTKAVGKYGARFAELTSLSVDEQAKRFLMVFVFEFQGRFEEVLDLGQEFKEFLPDGATGELEEDKAHMFLESRGETATVVQLRDELKSIDIDCNMKISFIEFLMFKYRKTLEDLFEPPDGPPPAHLLAALSEAIEWHTAHWARRATRNSMYEQLTADADDGGTSIVKKMRAKAQLKAERSRGWTQQWRAEEIHGAYQQRKADKAVKNADKTEMLKQAVKEEEQRLAALEEEAAQKIRIERMKSRAMLKARAALWESQ